MSMNMRCFYIKTVVVDTAIIHLKQGLWTQNRPILRYSKISHCLLSMPPFRMRKHIIKTVNLKFCVETILVIQLLTGMPRFVTAVDELFL